MRLAKLIDGVVDVISLAPETGPDWIAVPDDVFAGFVSDGQGGFTAPAPEPAPIPDRVTARQFKLQLLASGLLDPVEGWIAGQSQAVRIAYEASGTFVRDEPMMAAGFAALGFTGEQVDAFFTAAAAL